MTKLILTNRNGIAKRKRFAKRDAMMREIVELKKNLTPENAAKIVELQAQVDHIQKKIELRYAIGADFLPR